MKRITLLIMLCCLTSCTTYLKIAHSEPIKDNPGKRSLGSFIDDNTIETISNVNIAKSAPQLSQAHVSTTSFNGIVLLTGQVNSKNLKSIAGNAADNIKNVRKVYNELEVKGSTSYFARINDTWLTSKIKTRMIADSSIQSNRVKVVTENGIVYLMGLISRDEAARVVDLVQQSYGVQRIVKVFEYID